MSRGRFGTGEMPLLRLWAGLRRRRWRLAALRNRLVHVYDEIDDTRVHELLAAGLPDLDAFATALARLVR